MKLSNAIKIKFQKWVLLTVSWMVLGVFLAFYTDLLFRTGAFTTTPEYSFLASLLTGMAGCLFGGLFGGSLMVFFLQDRFKKKPFITKVIVNVVFVVLIILLVNLIISLFYIMFVEVAGMENQSVIGRMFGRIFSWGHLASQVTWLSIVALTTFIFSIADSYGPQVFLDRILGRFHRPFEEQRIFMFLDIRSSTTIAEALGHQKYFELLQDFYADIVDPVINTNGRIYQYVGDEVVITWDMESGLRNSNCLNCFFKMEENFDRLSGKYMHKYGLTPEFKAGVHFGNVTTGEVGILKKEIIHTGDVLNTTSRIENKCNWLGVNLLASGNLVDLIINKDHFRFESMGKIDLRGKMEMVELVAVSERL